MPQVRIPRNFNVDKALDTIELTRDDLIRELRGSSDWERTYLSMIKKAHRKMMKLYHPDRFKGKEKKERALERTQKINEAVNILKAIRPSLRSHPHPLPPPIVIYPYGMGGATTTSFNPHYYVSVRW